MRKVLLPCVSVYLLLFTLALHAQEPGVAQTPPMGWNSWDAYGLTITEPQFRSNVEVLRDKLKSFGWHYAVIDEGWYFRNPQDRPTPAKLVYALDPYGRFVPVPDRFPSAGTQPGKPDDAEAHPKLNAITYPDSSFAALGAWVHAQGLQFGIHIIRGIPKASVERNLPIEGSAFHAQDAADPADTCPWDPTSYGVRDNAAGQAWYNSLLRQYAKWGVDFLKVDCIADHPYKVTEIRQIRRAIDQSGRPMVLSLSPGPTQLSHAAEVSALANMWRISNDEWDVWDAASDQAFPQGVKNQFARLAAWEPWAKPGGWPDADMLPFGQLRPAPGWGKPRSTQLTLDEQRTEMTLWAMARSPLITGANLTLLDAPTLQLLTNPDVIRLNQTALHAQQVLTEGQIVAWRAELPGNQWAIALFNVGDTPTDARIDPARLGLPGGRHWQVHNAWTGATVSGAPAKEPVPAHGVVLWMFQPTS